MRKIIFSAAASLLLTGAAMTQEKIVISSEWQVEDSGVHHSTLAAKASDHLPVWARLAL